MSRSPVGRHLNASPPDPRLVADPVQSATSAGLAPGVELLGEYRGSGCTETPYLVRRADGRMLEVSHLLYLVASHLDADRDLLDVARRVGTGLGRPISSASIAYVVDRKLRPLGLIGTGDDAPAVRSGPATLGLRVRAGMIPPPVVRAVTTLLRPAFLPPVVAGALICWAAVDTWLLRHARLDMRHVVSTPALLAAVIGITLAAGLLHELGHATASHYGGAQPGVIGAGIYLIWPVFYNDLNDSYRLDRKGRLRADLGGVYFNVLVVLMLSALYGATGWAPLIVAIAVQHVTMAQQFLPFLRLDGYYVVSDLAGVPDLFGRILPILAALIPGHTAGPKASELKPGARAVVTAWVVATVPLLVCGAALLLLTLPAALGAGWQSVDLHARLLVDALRTGSVARALLNGVELGATAVPFVGLGAVLVGIASAWRARGRRHRQADVRPRVADGPVASADPPGDLVGPRPGSERRRLSLGGALVLVLICVTSVGRRRRRRT